MKIILLKSVRGLGDPGDIVNVKSGYARNYLIPNDFAMYATKASIAQTEYTIQKSKEAEEKRVQELQDIAMKLDKLSLKFELKLRPKFLSISLKSVRNCCSQQIISNAKY